MNTFDLTLISTLKEYIDFKLISKLNAWKNEDITLTVDTTDNRLVKYRKYQGPSRQWVYDSSVSGANIANPSGFPTSGWKTDFVNSRFIIPTGQTGVAPSSVNIAIKHFNSYVSSFDDQELFENTIFSPPEMLDKQPKPDSFHAPCYFVKMFQTNNEGFAFGGLDKTNFNIKITIFCKNERELLVFGSVIRDLKGLSVPLLSSTPLNEFNDLKSRPWNLVNELNSAESAGNSFIHIEDSSFNSLKSDNINSRAKNAFLGLGNLKVFVTRYPRQ